MATEVLTHRPIPGRRPLPPRIKVSYAKGVTCCIAAACRNHDEPMIVLCSDTRLDYGDLGSTNTTVKLDILGNGWCTQLAGEWSGVTHLRDILKARVYGRRTTLGAVEDHAHFAVEKFLKSPFYSADGIYELLISGFSGADPRILVVSVREGQPRIEMRHGFGCIGEASTVTNVLFSLREYAPDMDSCYVSYLVYEAKRASEKVGSVGKYTVMMLQEPGGDRDGAKLIFISDEGLANLENIYRGLWKRPLFEVDFPDSFLTYLEDLQHLARPKADPKPPQPPPESHAKSDES
jgi:hypothetical protein